MATKEDILEQIVEEYLIAKGYFVRHNVKFLPPKEHPEYKSGQDSNHSDIDVLGFHPLLEGPDKVWAVSCKSWQGGFRPDYWLKAIEAGQIVSGRPAWKSFRELCVPRWSDGFVKAICAATGTGSFTYVTAVARLVGPVENWIRCPSFLKAMNGNPLRVITFSEMVDEIQRGLSTTLAGSEVGRLLQMFNLAKIPVTR